MHIAHPKRSIIRHQSNSHDCPSIQVVDQPEHQSGKPVKLPGQIEPGAAAHRGLKCFFCRLMEGMFRHVLGSHSGANPSSSDVG